MGSNTDPECTDVSATYSQGSELGMFFILAGIEPEGNVVLKPATFTVETLEAGLGEVIVYVEDPEGHTEEVRHLQTVFLSYSSQVQTQVSIVCSLPYMTHDGPLCNNYY